MAQSEGAAWRKFLKPLVGAAVLFCTFNEWEDMNLEVDAGANGFAMPMFKLGILTADSDSNPSTITIDDYNIQSAYTGQKLQAWLDIEVESEGIA